MSLTFTLVYVLGGNHQPNVLRKQVARIFCAIERAEPNLSFRQEEYLNQKIDPAQAEFTSNGGGQCTPAYLLIEQQAVGPHETDGASAKDQDPLETTLLLRKHQHGAAGAIGCGSNNITQLDDRFHAHTSSQETSTSWSYSLLKNMILVLRDCFGLHGEAEALEDSVSKTMDPASYAGCGISPKSMGGLQSDEEFLDTAIFYFEYYLESIKSVQNPTNDQPSMEITPKRSIRPMGVIEKVLTNSAIGLNLAQVVPGQMICVGVDWVLTSELLWAGMEKSYNQMKRPRPHRNDRIWLAVDHTVDPRTAHLPKQQELMAKSEKFRDEAKVINYLPANTSIMHTDFNREKAQPGMIVVGSDSRTCSAGSMGALAVGFGAADAVMPLVTGETWFRVPEVCRINFTGSLPYGITGKDVILHILGLFKRNTIAFQRAVEYGGPSLHQLSMDARFAIANMTTEFGGMGACFEADKVTARWIVARRRPKDRTGGLYFKADPEANYAEIREIDLSQVELTMALYPNPDDVVPISAKSGMNLDGCFIGACTTTEEELILSALVLEAGLRSGFRPVRHGKRVVTPGSLIIIDRLESCGLLDFYREAGFEINAPSCSYCVGINDVDVAQPGEVWLSSQNRNFKNRMGKGSIGNITCAAAVAASSFGMKVTDPRGFLDTINLARYRRYLEPHKGEAPIMPPVQTPRPRMVSSTMSAHGATVPTLHTRGPRIITSRVQRFSANVDTDAIIPAEFMPGVNNEDLGRHCFEYFRPDFRAKAAAGATIIVAEHGFGSGSSREDAVRALIGAGVECVVAKGFAFIYKFAPSFDLPRQLLINTSTDERNQLNMGLYSAVIVDEEFYEHAQEGAMLTLDKNTKTFGFGESGRSFVFTHSTIEETLIESGGVLQLYDRHGKQLFREMIKPVESATSSHDPEPMLHSFGEQHNGMKAQLAW